MFVTNERIVLIKKGRETLDNTSIRYHSKLNKMKKVWDVFIGEFKLKKYTYKWNEGKICLKHTTV